MEQTLALLNGDPEALGADVRHVTGLVMNTWLKLATVGLVVGALLALGLSKLLAAPAAFVIGGAEGLSAETKGHADTLLRLSAMTLPHAIAQVVLLEQIYRAATLLTGHPYHRE